MNVIGLVAEFNPFHNGHAYLIKEIKNRYPDSIIITIISTNFTERGDISLINKWDKTKICLNNGIDIVLELPTIYATQSADLFAYGALSILNEFKIDTLVFGSESGDLETLKYLANVQVNNKEYNKYLCDYLSTGINYPTALNLALKKITKKEIKDPNDLLAISYLKEIIKNDYSITPIAIKRTNNYHDLNPTNDIASANAIRNMIKNNQDVTSYVPKEITGMLYKSINITNIYPYLIYSITANQNNLSAYLTVDEGIENRILKNIYTTYDYDSLHQSIKTKRYTYNKISRMFIHILLNIKKEDNNKEIYLRVLGFNQNGRKHLNKIKKQLSKEILKSYKPNTLNILDIEYFSTLIYSLITKDSSLIKKETQNKPIIKK